MRSKLKPTQITEPQEALKADDHDHNTDLYNLLQCLVLRGGGGLRSARKQIRRRTHDVLKREGNI